MLVGEKDMSGGSKGKHKGQSDKCYNKVIYKVLRDKMREQVLLFRLTGESFTG